jgi:hypothetical protein
MMKDHKQHPAAHSGLPVKPHAGGGPTFRLNEAATSEMKVSLPARHPAPGCTQKHRGEVKAKAKN